MDHRIHTLDAMRGVAAIAVVILHIGAILQLHTIPYAYVAVDFFFILSGFVLAGSMSRDEDMLIRRRIWIDAAHSPLSAIRVRRSVRERSRSSASSLLHSPHAISPPRAAFAFVMNMAILPVPGYSTLFPMNLPGWSLFFELVINGAFALVLYRLSAPFLAAVCALLAVTYIYAMVRIDPPDNGVRWPIAFLDLLRVGFSFVLGMLFARGHGFRIVTRSYCSVLAIAALAAVLSVSLPPRLEWYYRAVTIGLAMPGHLLVWRCQRTAKSLKKVGAFLETFPSALCGP